ncbi:MAG: HAD family hydrolase [Polyangiaceae bacterium]|nr:HAD family hydrolase [Polyangiaceae bacterium]
MARIRAVLFDVDGTLLDSNDAHAHAWLDALRGHGKSFPFEQVRSRIGMGSARLLRELVNVDADSLEGRALVEHRSAIFKAHYLPDLGPLPGARVLVDRIRSRGLSCVAVTWSSASDLVDLLRVAAVADLMDHVVTSDDVDQTKPDPDLVEAALARASVSAEEAVFVGDTPYDIALANHAGVAAIALRSGGWKDAELEGAVAIYDGPAELASRLDHSPICQGLDEEAVGVRRYAGLRARRAAMRGIM